jgi:hypothetical protein
VLFGCEDNEFTIDKTKEKFQSAHTICEIPFQVKMDSPTLSFEIMIPEWLPQSTMLSEKLDSVQSQVRYGIRATVLPEEQLKCNQAIFINRP